MSDALTRSRQGETKSYDIESISECMANSICYLYIEYFERKTLVVDTMTSTNPVEESLLANPLIILAIDSSPAVYPGRSFLEVAHIAAIASIEALTSGAQALLRRQMDRALECLLNANDYAVLRDRLIAA